MATETKPNVKIQVGQLEDYVKQFATADRSAPLEGLPFMRGDWLYVTVGHVQEHLVGEQEGVTRRTVSAALAKLNFEHTQVPTKDGSGKTVSPSYYRAKRKVSGVPQQDSARARKADAEPAEAESSNGTDPQADAGGES